MISGFQGPHRFLSNFWPAKTSYEGIEFPTSEHAYQAAKTPDEWERQRIKGLATPGEAKRAGAKLPWRDDFDKLRVMYAVVKDKFSREPMRAQLLATGEEKLIEANTWGDMFWGVCRGTGHNYLGKILMRVRKELRK